MAILDNLPIVHNKYAIVNYYSYYDLQKTFDANCFPYSEDELTRNEIILCCPYFV
jgi:hypothetical protein